MCVIFPRVAFSELRMMNICSVCELIIISSRKMKVKVVSTTGRFFN